MILLVTNRRDITTDFIVAELTRRGQRFFRLNTDQAHLAGLSFQVDESGTSWSLEIDNCQVDASIFSSGYFRRPALPDVLDEVERAFAQQVSGEWASLLNSFYAALKCRWLSRPTSIALAEDKPRQLMVAQQMGFRLPETLVGSTYAQVAEFVSSYATVVKPIKSGRIATAEVEQIAFTSRVGSIHPSDESAIEVSPAIYQREIDKICDVRVTVVGERVFACEIVQHTARSVDWRTRGIADLQYRAIQLEEPIASMCINLVRHLDLGFGAIDLVRDASGQLWFLEINPNGQWAWIERQAGLPISAAIVDVLTRRASS